MRVFPATLGLVLLIGTLAVASLAAGSTCNVVVDPQCDVPIVNHPPVADFSLQCRATVCSFDADASQDSDGQITWYNWTFGDGTYHNSSQSHLATHTFAAAGNYSVKLTVVDNENADADVTKTAAAAANQVPIARFNVTCNGLTCRFTSTSTDADGSVARVQWDFGDGTGSTAAAPATTFPVAGTFDVALRVWDNLGAYSTHRSPVAVSGTSGTPPPPPTASVTQAATNGWHPGQGSQEGQAPGDPAMVPQGDPAKSMPRWIWYAMIGSVSACLLGVFVVHRIQGRR